MKGQWIGEYAGSSAGLAIVELDEIDGHLKGAASIWTNNLHLPATYAIITAPLNHDKFELRSPLLPIDRQTGDPSNWNLISQKYPGVRMPTEAISKWARHGDLLYVSWDTNIRTHGIAVLHRAHTDRPSNYQPSSSYSWEMFKSYAATLEPHRFIFRGHHDNRWRLESRFHRTGRTDLLRYIHEQIPIVHQNLTGLTNHLFDLSRPHETAAFYGLLQHHGYPTPLLDWTYSPFVAAYFAYKSLPSERMRTSSYVRIFIFDRKEWINDFPQILKIAPVQPHFSLLEPLSIEKRRMLPQQAMSSVTNLVDIESYLLEAESKMQKTYLRVIDLPASQRSQVMRELSMMGITAGSLFPGLDGACEQMKERFFDL